MKWLLLFVASLIFTPYAHEMANASRVVPGFGGEIYIPLYPVVGYLIYNGLTGGKVND